MSNVLLLVGEPGAGKSTLFAEAFGFCRRKIVDHKTIGGPAREWLYRDGEDSPIAVELGAREGRHPIGYPGTDAMSMAAIVKVDTWLREPGEDEAPAIVAEGTRLANFRFVKACLESGHNLTVVLLHGAADAYARRQERGSDQNAQWLKGRQTAAANFYRLAVETMNVNTKLIRTATPLKDAAFKLRTWTGITPVA